jgi:hypothetical protein
MRSVFQMICGKDCDRQQECQTRLVLGAAMVVLAAWRIFTCSFVFSGDATLYYRFVRGMFRYWLVTGSFAAVGAVVIVPIFWRGSRPQIQMGAMLTVLAALAILMCSSIIREY